MSDYAYQIPWNEFQHDDCECSLICPGCPMHHRFHQHIDNRCPMHPLTPVCEIPDPYKERGLTAVQDDRAVFGRSKVEEVYPMLVAYDYFKRRNW